ncbi:hypothetical protein TeGR_g8460 [Tetraparma gracilis]|uniref:FAD synthase n=1 Tax=Tetraparma gracilis TaxID=2962635 RepID=A0ABQ6MVK2_9STRA|nr:hypothetical protein TeGR_g8460 [Tetraparma gracilis]
MRLYGPAAVISSYNGGKDACVVMHLHRAAHAHHFRQRFRELPDPPALPPAPRVVYFESPGEFPEIEVLLRETVGECALDMLSFRNASFSAGLLSLSAASPGPLAFALGTRAGDPNAAGQGRFEPSSDWMPPFMRVNPVLDWSYGHVWHFLRLFGLPYCSLYDGGFTSLGSVGDTDPTGALKKPGGEATGYWPAYMLADYSKERDGRRKKGGGGGEPPKRRESIDGEVRAGEPVTVGLLVIGDEILKGAQRDTNTHAAAAALQAAGVPLARAATVADDEGEIGGELGRMSQAVDVIVTSGGLGPTHDDVTLKAVASALASPLRLNEEMLSLVLRKSNKESADEPMRKMCMLPANSKLLYLEGADEWPVLQVGKVFTLPGVPEFFERKVKLIAKHLQFRKPSTRFSVVLNADEMSVVDVLNRCVSNHPRVAFGSYPIQNSDHKTVVTLEARGPLEKAARGRSGSEGGVIPEGEAGEGEGEERVAKALEELLAELPKESVLRVEQP